MFFDRVASVLWPARCAGCNAFVAEGTAFCESCEISVVPLGASCPGCALPVTHGEPCSACQRSAFAFARAWASLDYGGALSQAILRWKHGGHRHIVRCLARYVAPLLALAAKQGAELACPVPLHPRRLRQRGFNQALDLLRAARRQTPHRDSLRILCDALDRKVDTPSLGHGSPAERRRAVADAFVVRRPAWIQGKNVLVMDDVMTTGATLSECARALLRAGARSVAVIALARVS